MNFVNMRAEMRYNSYSTYDDLVDPTLYNNYEYVDIEDCFSSFVNRVNSNEKSLFKLNLYLSDT